MTNTTNRPVVIVVASQKGGVGKSTICANLALAAEQEGLGPVALFDADPQQSLAGWYDDREQETPLLASGPIGQLDAIIERGAGAGIRLFIIDTPPSIANATDDILRRADFVLIPTQDGRPDLRAAADTVERVRTLGKKFAFVLTFIKGSAQAAEAAKVLSREGQIAALIGHRMIFKTAWNTASAAVEAEPKGKAASEIMELWRFVGKETGLIKPAKKKDRI